METITAIIAKHNAPPSLAHVLVSGTERLADWKRVYRQWGWRRTPRPTKEGAFERLRRSDNAKGRALWAELRPAIASYLRSI